MISWSHSMKRLNGWQRLWIVVSILLIIPSALIIRQSLKSESDVYWSWYISLTSKVLHEDLYYEKNEITILHNFTNTNLETLEGLKEAIVIINERHSREEAKTQYKYINLSNINEQYLNELISLSDVRKKQFLIRTPIVWVASAFSLYLIGLVILWIRKGFKNL